MSVPVNYNVIKPKSGNYITVLYETEDETLKLNAKKEKDVVDVVKLDWQPEEGPEGCFTSRALVFRVLRNDQELYHSTSKVMPQNIADHLQLGKPELVELGNVKVKITPATESDVKNSVLVQYF